MSEENNRISIITGIERQKKNSRRVSVFLNKRFWKGLDQEVVVALRLKSGDRVRPKDLERVVLAEEKKKALDRALKLLEYRERSISEIERRLTRHGFENEVTDGVVEDLKGLGYLDDTAFSEMWTKERIAKGYGERRIRSELFQKGVNKRVIDDVFERLLRGADEISRVTDLAQERLKSLAGLEPQIAYRRLSQYLLRRGFTPSTVYETCQRLIRDQ